MRDQVDLGQVELFGQKRAEIFIIDIAQPDERLPCSTTPMTLVR